MVRRFVTPAQRKRRIVRDTLLLVIILVILTLRLDIPVLTANQALEATQARYFFGPGEIISTQDYYINHLVSRLCVRSSARVGS